jgi:hypothetical protein
LFFIQGYFFVIAKDEQRLFQFYKTKMNEDTWIKLKAPSLPIYDCVIKNEQLVYLSSNIPGTDKKNLLVQYKIEDSASSIIELPEEFDCYFLTTNGEEIKLSGLNKGHNIAIYTVDGNNHIKYNYSYLKDRDYFPQGFYSNKNEEWIIAGKRGYGDVSNKLFKTTDKGKNWEIINFEKDDYIKPFSFLDANNKTKAWFYSGAGKFQVLK